MDPRDIMDPRPIDPAREGQQRRLRPSTVGIVLAGGKASRLGALADAAGGKAAIEFGGRSLLDHVVAAVGAEVDEVIVVAAAGQPVPTVGGVRVVRDSVPGAGPLAGIRDGLQDVVRRGPAAELAFIASCDVPRLRREVVRLLVTVAAGSRAAWTVPVVRGHRQVLLSVLRTALLPRIEAYLAAGRRDLRGLHEQIAGGDPRDVRELAEAELVAVDATLDSFLDIDTPDDLQRLRGE